MDLAKHYAEAEQAGARGGLPTGPACHEVDMSKYHLPQFCSGTRVGLSPPPAASSPGADRPYVLPRAALDPLCQQLHRQLQLAKHLLAVRDLTVMRMRGQLGAQQAENEQLRQQLADAQHAQAVADCLNQELEAVVQLALKHLAAAGVNPGPILSVMEGGSTQQAEEVLLEEQHQQQQQAGCETPSRAEGEGWEQQQEEGGEHQICATPWHATFKVVDPFKTPQKQQQQPQMETSMQHRAASTPHQAPSRRLTFTLGVDGEQGTGVDGQAATEEVEVLSAAGAGVVAGGEVQQHAGELGVGVWGEDEEEEEEEGPSPWVHSSASLAHSYPAAASPKAYSLFGGADLFGPGLLLAPAAPAAVSTACPAAASHGGGSLLDTSAFAAPVRPYILGAQPSGGPAASCTFGAGGSCCGVAAPSHCHVSADAYQEAATASSLSHVARQPEQGAASFAVLRTPLRTPRRTPVDLRSCLPAVRSVSTPAGVKGRSCRGGGGK